MPATGIPVIGAVLSSPSYTCAQNYGCKGDARYFTDGYVNDGTHSTSLSTLYSATANFTSADTGKTVAIGGAGASGNTLICTVTYASSTTLTLGTAATAAVSAAYCALGTENTTALQNALNATASTSRTFTSAAAITSGAATLTITGGNLTQDDVGSYVRIAGAGASGADLYNLIVSVTNATTATLAINAGTTVSSATCVVMKSGGLCYLPAGNYLLSGNVYVPQNVALVGSYEALPGHYGAALSTHTPSPWSGGTTLFIVGGSGSSTGTSPLNLWSNATLKGLSIFYPNQPVLGTSSNAPVAYPYTITLLANGSATDGSQAGFNAKVESVELINCYQGIYIFNHACPVIRDVRGQAYLLGIYIDDCRDVAILIHVHWSIFWDSQSGLMPTWCHGKSQAFVFGRADELYVTNCFCYQYWQAFVCFNTTSGTTWVVFVGCGADVCNYGAVINQAQDFGARFVDCDFTTIGTNALYTDSGFTGGLNMSGCLLDGAATSISGSGDVSLDNCRFESSNITTAGVHVQITNCRFPTGGAGVITLGSTTLTAVVTSNRLGASGTIVNNIGTASDYVVANNLAV